MKRCVYNKTGAEELTTRHSRYLTRFKLGISQMSSNMDRVVRTSKRCERAMRQEERNEWTNL